MSSISVYKGARGDTLRAIQFMGIDRKRRSIRFGVLPANDVEDIKRKIDLVEIYRKGNRAPDPDTAKWLATVDNSVYDKLAAGGLVEPREGGSKPKGMNLGAFLEVYIGQRQLLVPKDLSPRTLAIEQVTRDCLLEKFGAEMPLSEITEGHADDFRNYLLSTGGRPAKRCGSETVIRNRKPLSESTTRKRCSIAAKMFGYAVRRRFIGSNPFASVPRANIATTDHAYIKAADAKAVQAKLPGTQWQLLFALCRWGGLRIGEPRLLTWADILWDENRILVHSPKTARHSGHSTRLVPIFPEIAELLGKRFQDAADGDEHVLPFLQGRSDASLRKTIERAIVAAGVAPWPRLWHNLRGTRQNELLEAGFKRKAVCAWLGNSSEVAHDHYEKLTDADWAQASAPLFAPPAEKTLQTR